MSSQKSAKLCIDRQECCFLAKWPLWTVLLQYYGHSHDGFLLLNRLCKKSRTDLLIKHKVYCYATKHIMKEADFDKMTNPTAISLYKLNIAIDNKESINTISKLVMELNQETSDIKFINWGRVSIKFETLKEFRNELEQILNQDFHESIVIKELKFDKQLSPHSENSLLGLNLIRASLRKYNSILYPSHIEDLYLKNCTTSQLETLRSKLLSESQNELCGKYSCDIIRVNNLNVQYESKYDGNLYDFLQNLCSYKNDLFMVANYNLSMNGFTTQNLSFNCNNIQIKIPNSTFTVISADKPNIKYFCKELIFIGEFDSQEYYSDKNLLWLSQNCKIQINGLEMIINEEFDSHETILMPEDQFNGICIFKNNSKSKIKNGLKTSLLPATPIQTIPSNPCSFDTKITISSWPRIRSIHITDKASNLFLKTYKNLLKLSTTASLHCLNTKLDPSTFKKHFLSKKITYQITTQCCSKHPSHRKLSSDLLIAEFTAKDLKLLSPYKLASVTILNPYLAAHNCQFN